ncbi:MAG TPA: cytochrome C [Hydrogenophaga sp.]|jgi:cytochrome c556|uniref:c-type cytochrome n=1 Tax=Hydrogenophaga TaxID=47420 RepID=UPI0008BF9F45|nr:MULTISPECIES: cytochrome c [Hydrogenophaga]MBU4182301.1 cytochrome c [Gammaproteobacteria bacterium]MBW8467809.1 cytochrome c [Thiobacillus sp.]OGA73637.1 MAG: cytochrome C [Burkholderiales bacterium GWE1_65_30]OGA92131.1 MAG: cytochrome C [Burkholderiales bacterium GWF1_66_17]OGB32217.1 MAG: cytochrome C [Burkholderiales bacterium RIFCSPLOWO2_02_FULL_66_35]OGB35150.1 MAG: cytochrome C [Burkholderiales bacterium RIFCSPHIGHO2_02_FULL_66_10]PKO26799.1 MAG: cytochrome C [Betaproteobacteria b
MKMLASIALAAAAISLSAPAAAQFQKPEDAVKYRKAAFTVMGAHFGRIGAMASGKVPFDAKVAADNAAIVETMSKLPYAGFVPGTDKGDTRALPAIWTEQAKFNAAAEKMQGEVSKLAAAAKTGNLDAVKTAFGAAGQSCKACHDDFRKD